MSLLLGKLLLSFTGLGILILAWFSQDVNFGMIGIAEILLTITVQLHELIIKK